MKNYTKCMDCGSIFPSSLEKEIDAIRRCPVCKGEGLCTLEETDVEAIIDADIEG